MLYFGPRGKKIRWQNPLQLKLLLHKAVNGQQIYDSFMRRESIDKKQKSFRCLLCQCSHLLPDWRLCLASAGAGSPVECCRLPPAGAQRSWLSSPSPPPPSRSPLTGSPEDTTAPSSHLWKRDAMGNISITASDFSARSSTVCCSVRWKAPHKNATWFETLKRRQQSTKLMNPLEYASLHISNYRPHVCPAAFRQMQKFNRGIFHAD